MSEGARRYLDFVDPRRAIAVLADMHRWSGRLRLALAALVALHLAIARPGGAACQSSCTQQLAECKRTCPGGGQGRRECRTACAERAACAAPGAGFRVMSYVLTECSVDMDAQRPVAARQSLVVRRGNCDPVTVREFTLAPLGPEWFGVCVAFGGPRVGDDSVRFGVFQRTAVLPHGSGVVFEVTNELSKPPTITPEPPEEGIFFVRADGTGLRPLGPASRVRPFVVPSDSRTEWNFAVSPDGRTIAFSDLGPDGETAQVFALDIATARRTQVTRLPASAETYKPALACLTFLDNRTLGFCIREFTPAVGFWLITGGFTVRTDGSRFEEVPSVALPGAAVIPKFGVAGGRRSVAMTIVFFPAEPVNDIPVLPGLRIIEELFLVDARNVVQLTNFGRSDTVRAGIGGAVARGRVFFGASADPFGTNPGQHCQIFSVNTRGGGLRQLTRLHDEDGRPSAVGCMHSVAGACTIDRYFADRRTGAVTFMSNCDPVGRNPSGDQVFSMRPDGSGLRQLTSARGLWRDTDGTIHFELPGPVAIE